MATRLKPVPPAADTAVSPSAPRGLSRRQRGLWRSIAASKPPTWWDGASLPLLAALVRHIETAELLQVEFDRLGSLSTPAALARLEQLSRLRDRESKAMSSLATKLRLTAQSRYEPRAAFRAGRLRAADNENPFATFKTRRSA